MKRIRVADLAERDLDEIWYYVAKQSQSIEIVNSVVESLTGLLLPFLRIRRKPEFAATTSTRAPRVFGR